jgi:hypothetical protein
MHEPHTTTGLCYYNRSDEQKVWAKTLGMFAPPSAVHLFGSVWNPAVVHGSNFAGEKLHLSEPVYGAWMREAFKGAGIEHSYVDFQLKPSVVGGGGGASAIPGSGGVYAC